MAKIKIGLFFIVLMLLFNCSNSQNCCVNPYVITIANTSKKERNITIKLYIKKENNKIEFPFYILSSPNSSKSNGELLELTVKENEKFNLYFSPYEDNEENIGKENIFYYKIYENDALIIDKKITIKSTYLDSKNKNAWKLKTEVFKIENESYLKEISKEGYPFIKLEF